MNGQCYECQYEQRKHEIGKNKAAYDGAMIGNTVSEGICDICGEKKFILPFGDIDRAIRASNNEFIHPLEWD